MVFNIQICSLLCAAGLSCKIGGLDDCYSDIFPATSTESVGIPGESYTVLFVVSTTGDGKHPSNMKNFWR